ncbi:MAG: ABC transporter ATP-binding protein [Nitrospinota bacterium]|nr:ABC transporter ATP-binding protein [Nitrospinota bacterium]
MEDSKAQSIPPTQPPGAIVIGSALVKKYGELTAVDGIDFSIRKGELFGFLGPNGAGKTSTIRMIQCFSPITEGQIMVDGTQVGHDDRKIKAILGVAPQEDNLDEDLTVIKNLVIYAGYFGIRKEIAIKRSDELLSFFHLEEKREARLRTLSGGMRRRLIIARALLNNPKLLILDEPTTGLDPQARHVIWERVRGLKQAGVTMVLTTHYMEEAAQLCDRIAIMDHGRIVLEGNPGDLVAENFKGNVVEYRPASEIGKLTVQDMEARGVSVEKAGDTYILHTDDPDGVIRQLARHDFHFLRKRSPNLEDLFLKATGRALGEGA